MLSLNLQPSSFDVAFNKSKFPNRTHFHPLHLKSAYRALNLRGSLNGSPNSGLPLNPNSQISDSPSKLNLGRILGYPFRVPTKPRSTTPKAATSAFKSDETPAVPSDRNKTLKLGLVFGLWYLQNIVFNIYNKKVLNIFNFPWLLASFLLFVGSIWMLVLWSTKLQQCPKISKSFIVALLGLAICKSIWMLVLWSTQ